jgi:hypothetical protein
VTADPGKFLRPHFSADGRNFRPSCLTSQDVLFGLSLLNWVAKQSQGQGKEKRGLDMEGLNRLIEQLAAGRSPEELQAEAEAEEEE